jgi:hypothetical protein
MEELLDQMMVGGLVTTVRRGKLRESPSCRKVKDSYNSPIRFNNYPPASF